MDVTTMPSISSLIPKLAQQYPDITFIEAEQFAWSPTERTISYAPQEAAAEQLLLHELSHALLDHHEYQRDIQLLQMETAAWEKAKTLAPLYEAEISEDVLQDHLDTYREWMHARSTCPECKATGYQTGALAYSCPACAHEWRVNEARLCGLKRYSLK